MLVHKTDIAERHRHAARVIKRVGVPDTHGRAGVDRDDERKILLFEEHLEKELVEAAEDIPIDKSQVIAVDIRAKVGELDALSASARATLALKLAGKNLPTHHVDRVEL